MSSSIFYITFELNNKSKKTEKDIIIRDIKRSLLFSNKKSIKSKKSNFKTIKQLQDVVEGLDFFLPFRELQKGGYYHKDKEYYIPGYGFLEHHPDIHYSDLEDTTHINKVIKNFNTNKLELTPSDVINSERIKMQDFFKGQFKSGQLVEVIDGDYANMLGRVVDYQEKDQIYRVIVVSRSHNWYLRLNSFQLRVRDEDLISLDSM